MYHLENVGRESLYRFRTRKQRRPSWMELPEHLRTGRESFGLGTEDQLQRLLHCKLQASRLDSFFLSLTLLTIPRQPKIFGECLKFVQKTDSLANTVTNLKFWALLRHCFDLVGWDVYLSVCLISVCLLGQRT